MHSFSPETIVQSVAKAHAFEVIYGGGDQGVYSGHGSNNWYYYSRSRVDDLEAAVDEINRAFEVELGRLGAHVTGHGTNLNSILVNELTYTHGSRVGTLKIIAARLEKGTAIDISLDEHPK